MIGYDSIEVMSELLAVVTVVFTVGFAVAVVAWIWIIALKIRGLL